MPKGYHQLTYEQRCQICTLKANNFSQNYIAKQINTSASTISRELSRNSCNGTYHFKAANQKAKERRSMLNKSRLTQASRNFIIQQLQQNQASPVQISGRMKRQKIPSVSHEYIYRMIRRDKQNGGKLYLHCRHQGKKYNKRLGKTAGRGCIPHRKDIDHRPRVVDKKQRVGDIELDTVIGAKHQGAIVSMVDRASKFTKLVLVRNKEAKSVTRAIVDTFSKYQGIVKTFTADNGKEFAYHQEITNKTGADVYFAKPYHSWQRGLNEHTNGLIRQYFPKKTNFLNITEKDLQQVEDVINNRPRKILNFQTPKEVFIMLVNKQHGVALQC